MMKKAGIAEYEKYAGKHVIEELKLLAKKLEGKKIQCITFASTAPGALDVVTETLSRLIPLLNELGVDAGWDVIESNKSFLDITKAFHSALSGTRGKLKEEMFNDFIKTSNEIVKNTKLYGDIIFVHGLQPICLIKKKHKMNARWLWRCHVDSPGPNREVWLFLKNFIDFYDASVFSNPRFSREIPGPQFLITPSIDPFSDRNRPLSSEEIKKVLTKYGIDEKKPIISRISMDGLGEDPVEVIESFRLVKKYTDCQLILAVNKASLDHESEETLALVKEKTRNEPDIHILQMDSVDLDINAIQEASRVIVQKSIKEGCPLTVTEALWKAKPVVASCVGGGPAQIIHNYSGLLYRTVAGCATHIRQLLNNPGLRKKIGENGKEHVRKKFLSTRHLKDYMLLFLYLYQPGDVVSLDNEFLGDT